MEWKKQKFRPETLKRRIIEDDEDDEDEEDEGAALSCMAAASCRSSSSSDNLIPRDRASRRISSVVIRCHKMLSLSAMLRRNRLSGRR
jgi:hypothetical protein